MKENEKITELNNEALSENEMNAYLSVADEDTPDLWGRIEAGFDEEIKALNNIDAVSQGDENKEAENKKVIDINSRRRRKKMIGFLAACVIITVIAIPVFNTGRNNKSAEDTISKSDEYGDAACADAPNEYEEYAEACDAASGSAPEDAAEFDSGADEEIEYVNGVTSDSELSQSSSVDAENTKNDGEKYIMIDGAIYMYAGETVNELPASYELAGTVVAVDNENMPDEEFKGMNIEKGQKIYTSSNDKTCIYIEASSLEFEKFIKK